MSENKEEGEVINGIDLGELRGYIDSIREDPSVAERNLTVVARWVGGSGAEVDYKGRKIHIGRYEEGDPSSMWMQLATLATCDVEVVATHAALLGLTLDSLEVEASGHFDIRRLLGLKGPGPGYDGIRYTVRLKAPGATQEQIARLREACEGGSPVGDTLTRRVPLKLEIRAD